MTRRHAAALGISIAVHAALVAFAWTRVVPPAARPISRDQVRIDLVAPPPPKAVPTPPPPAPPPKRVVTKRPVSKIESAPTPPKFEAPPQPETPIVQAPPEVPKIETAPQPPSGGTKPIDLFHPGALGEATRGLVVPQQPNAGKPLELGRLPGEAAGEHATTEAQRVAERVAGATLDQSARARVQAGIVDPRYTKIGRAILDGWDPDRALPETSAELWAKRRAQNAVIAAKLWQEAGSNYGRNGSPFAEGESLDEAVRTDLRPQGQTPGGIATTPARETYRQYMKGKFNEGRSALVLVDMALDQTVTVSLVKSSGDMDIDRAAIEDIRSAMQRLKEQGIAAGAGKSLWSMRLQIIVNPPIPTVSFTFDEVLESPKLELPLGRKLLKRVQLEAVYDDDPRLSPGSATP